MEDGNLCTKMSKTVCYDDEDLCFEHVCCFVIIYIIPELVLFLGNLLKDRYPLTNFNNPLTSYVWVQPDYVGFHPQKLRQWSASVLDGGHRCFHRKAPVPLKHVARGTVLETLVLQYLSELSIQQL